ncbi:unnamed protein product [Protopolystoma xenopodis]|uniref:Uncharacterized protein n=1 Tax=Protopolystoma xenopodis TaxID=117903 RepID=A0A448XEE9_9PLAT|nr:unnamed protein product [Protopolystoma xenopodis]
MGLVTRSSLHEVMALEQEKKPGNDVTERSTRIAKAVQLCFLIHIVPNYDDQRSQITPSYWNDVKQSSSGMGDGTFSQQSIFAVNRHSRLDWFPIGRIEALDLYNESHCAMHSNTEYLLVLPSFRNLISTLTGNRTVVVRFRRKYCVS